MSRKDAFKKLLGDKGGKVLGVIGGFIGAAFGGPAGALKGAALGYGLGSSFTDTEEDIFDPPPNLESLEVQTSEYSSDIYRARGDNLIAGNLEWLRDNKIHVIQIDDVDEYAATFAVSIQAGAGTITKIFADGELIYDVSSDTPSSMSEGGKEYSHLTVYGSGSANVVPQEIAWHEADTDIPGWRGVILVVITDLKLKKFDNRIPTLKFATSDIESATPATPDVLRVISGGETLAEGGLSDPRVAGNEIMPWYYDGGVLNCLKVVSEFLPTWEYEGVTYSNAHMLLKIRNNADSTDLFLSEEFIVLQPSSFFGGILNNDYANVRVYPIRNSPGLLLVSWLNSAGRYRSAIGSGQFVVLARLGHLFGTTSFWNVEPSMTYEGGYVYICTGGSTFIGSGGQVDGVDGVIQVDMRNVPSYPPEESERNIVSVKSFSDVDYMCVGALDSEIFLKGIYVIDTTGLRMLWLNEDMTERHEYTLTTQAVAGDIATRPFFASYKSTAGDWVTVRAGTTSLILGSADFEELGTTSSSTGTDPVGVVQYSNLAGFARNLSDPWNFTTTVNEEMIGFGGVTPTDNISVADTLSSELALNPYLNFEDVDVSGLTDEQLAGYTVTGRSSQAAVIKPLMKAYRFGVYEADYQIKFKSRVNGTVVATLTIADLQAHEVGSAVPDESVIVQLPDQASPGQITVSYLDAGSDFEKGTESAERINTINNSQQEVDLPMVLDSDTAAKIAHILLDTVWLENQGVVSIRTSFKYSFIEVEDLVTVVTSDRTFTIRVIDIEKGKPGIVLIQGVFTDIAGYSSDATGVDNPSSSITITATSASVLQLIDCVAIRDSDEDFGLYYSTYQDNPNGAWSGAEVFASLDFQRWNTLGALNEGAIVCTAFDTLSDNGITGIWDETEELIVKIVNGSLSTVTDVQAANGANFGVYGDVDRWEIVKFTTVTDNGDDTVTLSRFMRGYFGTDDYMGAHQQGDRLIIFSATTWGRLASKDSSIYQATQYYKAITKNNVFNRDDSTVYKSISEARVKRKPVHIKATRDSSSDITFSWFKQSGSARQWVDADWTDSDTYNFEVDVLSGAGGSVLRTLTASGSNAPFTVSYTSAQQVTDFASNQTAIYVNIYELDATTGRGKVGQGLAI